MNTIPFTALRMDVDSNPKFAAIVAEVQQYCDMTPEQIGNYMFADWSNGVESVSDQEQEEWLNTADAIEIADWIIAGQQ